jgi:hypothetical protein
MNYEALSRRRVWSPSPAQDLSDCPPLIYAAKDALMSFATRQLGLALGPARWEARVEQMDLHTPAGWGPGAALAVLDFKQSPPAMLAVELGDPKQFTAWLMRERTGPPEPGRARVWRAAQAILVPADTKQLHSALDKLLAEGVITKEGDGLRFTGKRPSFRSL